MILKRQAHVVYKTQYHIVWITKYRRKILNPGVASYFKIKLQEVQKYYPDWVILTIGTDKDHVHVHMEIPPKFAVSKVVETIKTNTSRELKQKFGQFLKKVYWGTESIWGVGYFVSTVGINEAIIKEYVESQGREESGQAQLELW